MNGHSKSSDSETGADGISARLVRLRELYGWSAAEMARRASIPRRSMENYLKGQKPGVDALIAMSRGFDVPVDWLLGDERKGPEANSAIVAEAAWQGVRGFLQDIVSDLGAGRSVFEDGKIYGKEVDQYSVNIANNISQKYLYLTAYSKRVGSDLPGD